MLQADSPRYVSRYIQAIDGKDDGPLAELFQGVKPELVDRDKAAGKVDALERVERKLNGRGGHRARRRAENELAEYIEKHVCDHPDAYDDDRIQNLPFHMRCCRRAGAFGVLNDRLVVVWKQKCGELHLCPDEAREEQERLQARYVPAIEKFIALGYRPFKLTISPRNIPAGHLAWGQKQLFNRWRAFRRARWPRGSAERGLMFKEIEGALLTLEAPLSRHGDWNVHLNALILVKGELDYGKLQHWWGCQVEIDDWIRMKSKTREKLQARGVDVSKLTDAEVLHHALEEIVKYPIQTVAEKSAGPRPGEVAPGWSPETGQYHGERGPTAPPMTAWPPPRFVEWYRGQKSFRRTRSYGLLFGLPDPAPEETPLEEFKKSFVRVGFVRWNGSRYIFSLPGSLDLIPRGGQVDNDRGRKRGVGPPVYDREALIQQIMDTHRRAWERNETLAANF